MREGFDIAAGESLPGVLHRVAAAHAYARTSEFLASVGLTFDRQLYENLTELEAAIGIPTGLLDQVAPRADAAAHPLLQDRYDRRARGPVCPCCIAENRSHQQAWRHRLITACAVHAVQLAEICPACTRPFGAVTGGLTRCACGMPLSQAPSAPASDSEQGIASLISGSASAGSAPAPAPFDGVVPPDIAAFLCFLANAHCDHRTGKPGKAALPKTLAETRQWLEPAHALLSDWPGNFDDHVRMRLDAGDPDAASAPARLGNWYQGLLRFDHPAYLPFRERLERIIAERFEGPYRSPFLTEAPQAAWISAAEAARRLSVRPERIVEAVRAGRIEGRLRHSGLGHRHTMVRSDDIDSISASAANNLDKSDARAQLGLTRAQFRMLEDAGLLGSMRCDPAPVFARGQYDQTRLRAILAELAEQARTCTGPSVAFRDLTLRRTTDRAALLSVISEILAGDLPAIAGSTDRPFAGWEFPAEAVADRLTKHGKPQGMGVPEVSLITGWKPACIAAWCQADLLTARRIPHGPGATYVVRAEDLARFQATYMPVASLAHQTGRSSRGLIAEFGRHGIVTVGSVAEGKTARGHLARLADLAQVATARPAPDRRVERKGSVAQAG